MMKIYPATNEADVRTCFTDIIVPDPKSALPAPYSASFITRIIHAYSEPVDASVPAAILG